MSFSVPSKNAGTYDVQSVSITATPETGVLELGCIFGEGSQAQSCILTICRKENNNIIEPSCMNVHIDRNILTEMIKNLSSGLYTIIEVAEVERDGNVTILRIGGALQLYDLEIITPIPPSTNSGLK